METLVRGPQPNVAEWVMYRYPELAEPITGNIYQQVVVPGGILMLDVPGFSALMGEQSIADEAAYFIDTLKHRVARHAVALSVASGKVEDQRNSGIDVLKSAGDEMLLSTRMGLEQDVLFALITQLEMDTLLEHKDFSRVNEFYNDPKNKVSPIIHFALGYPRADMPDERLRVQLVNTEPEGKDILGNQTSASGLELTATGVLLEVKESKADFIMVDTLPDEQRLGMIAVDGTDADNEMLTKLYESNLIQISPIEPGDDNYPNSTRKPGIQYQEIILDLDTLKKSNKIKDFLTRKGYEGGEVSDRMARIAAIELFLEENYSGVLEQRKVLLKSKDQQWHPTLRGAQAEVAERMQPRHIRESISRLAESEERENAEAMYVKLKGTTDIPRVVNSVLEEYGDILDDLNLELDLSTERIVTDINALLIHQLGFYGAPSREGGLHYLASHNTGVNQLAEIFLRNVYTRPSERDISLGEALMGLVNFRNYEKQNADIYYMLYGLFARELNISSQDDFPESLNSFIGAISNRISSEIRFRLQVHVAAVQAASDRNSLNLRLHIPEPTEMRPPQGEPTPGLYGNLISLTARQGGAVKQVEQEFGENFSDRNVLVVQPPIAEQIYAEMNSRGINFQSYDAKEVRMKGFQTDDFIVIVF